MIASPGLIAAPASTGKEQWLLFARHAGDVVLAVRAADVLRLHASDDVSLRPRPGLPSLCQGEVSAPGLPPAAVMDVDLLLGWPGAISTATATAAATIVWLDARSVGAPVALRLGRCLRLASLDAPLALPGLVRGPAAIAGAVPLVPAAPGAMAALMLDVRRLLPAAMLAKISTVMQAAKRSPAREAR